MKYCPDCQSILTPVTSTGALKFHCRCKTVVGPDPDDTLLFSGIISATTDASKFTATIDRSPFDPAARREPVACPGCRMPYLCLIYVTANLIPMYTCTCGKKYTPEELALPDSTAADGAAKVDSAGKGDAK